MIIYFSICTIRWITENSMTKNLTILKLSKRKKKRLIKKMFKRTKILVKEEMVNIDNSILNKFRIKLNLQSITITHAHLLKCN